MKECQIVIIGGGPAGLAAAIKAREEGIKDILILEREKELGGILNQCIHNGFGLHTFKEELTGPEYAQRFIDKVEDLKIPYMLNTMVIDLNKNKEITAVNDIEGIIQIRAESIILAMGCRERPRGAICIPGSRCAGIYTAGAAQKFVNIEGLMPGKEVVVLGSGDIGLIMARRMTLEGAKVKAVVELMPYSGGLKRNIVQCLDDYNIPLKLSHTVINIKGKERLEGVTIAKVDKSCKPIPGTEEYIPCDTLLLSVGLLPENELSTQANVDISSITGGPVVSESLETNIDGIFACGNVLHVHDLVDYVTTESYNAGKNAAVYVVNKRRKDIEDMPVENPADSGKCLNKDIIKVATASGVRYTVPMSICPEKVESSIDMRFRTGEVFKDKFISVYFDDVRVFHIKKKVLAPGEMETIKITKDMLNKHPQCKKISVMVEED